MRDLRKTVDLISSESAMDYCEEFDEIKSVLDYCNKHDKPFNKLHFRSGNQSTVNELVNRLQQILIKHGYVDETSENKEPRPEATPKLRKIMLFLIANTDATYKFNLRDDAQFTHIVEVCPLMPKFLLVAILSDLQLHELFYELLSYAPAWLTFQYFEVAVDALKYVDDPLELLEKVDQLLCAMFSSVTLMELRQMDSVDKRITCGKIYDAAVNLLRHVYTPDADKFKGFTAKQKKRFYGYCMKNLLSSVMFFYNAYEKPEFLEPVLFEVYEICVDQCPRLRSCYTHEQFTSGALKEHQLKLVHLLHNAIQNTIMNVDLNSFVCWAEVYVMPDLTLQRCVGEASYRVSERMLANPAFVHDMCNQLKIFALKPLTLSDIASDATIGQILCALEDDLPLEKKVIWFNELMGRSTVFGNEECLESIDANKSLISVDNLMVVLNYLKGLETLLTETLVEEDLKLKEIIVASLNNFSIDELLKLLKYQWELFNFSPIYLFNQSHGDYAQQVTMFLNKHNTVEKFDVKEFLKLIFQNPYYAWKQLFSYACSRAESLKIFCEVLRSTKLVTSVYMPRLMDESLEDGSELHQQLHAQLLCEVYFILYHPHDSVTFLEHTLENNIVKLVDEQMPDGVLTLVLALKNIAKYGETESHKPNNFGDHTCLVLFHVVLIMDSVRWDISNYTEKRHELLCECIDFVQHTNKNFLPLATSIDRNWISKNIVEIFGLHTQFYFQKYALVPGQAHSNFDRFVLPEDIDTAGERVDKLVQEMLCCTKKETEWLVQSERFKGHYCDAMLKLSAAMQHESKRIEAINNYRRCLANFCNIAKTILVPSMSEDKIQLGQLLFYILAIIAKIPEEMLAETFLSVLWLPLDILELHLKQIDFEMFKRLIIAMDKVINCKAKEMLCEKLETLVSK